MKPQEFVLRSLLELSKKFGGEMLEYHFCKNTKVHIVKVVSQKLYDNDGFKSAEADIYDSFYDLNSDEEIMFVSTSNDFEFIKEPYDIILDGFCMDHEEYIQRQELLKALKSTKKIESNSSDSYLGGSISYDECDFNYALAA